MSVTEFQPDPNHYKVLQIIGYGHNGGTKISLGLYLPTNVPVAIKQVDLENCNFEAYKHECMMHKELSHHNVLSIHSSFVHNREIWLVLPLMAYGSCFDLIQAHFTRGLPELAIAHIARDILQALNYIHELGFIHRSMRAKHVLISTSGCTVLTGLRFLCNTMNCGKRQRLLHDFPDDFDPELVWASPELLGQSMQGYTTKSDIYSFGMTICELANGVVPFSKIPLTQMLIEKMNGFTPRLLDSSTLPEFDSTFNVDDDSYLIQGNPLHDVYWKRTFTSNFHDFVRMCLQKDSFRRLSAGELLQHPFIKQLKRKSLADTLPNMLLPLSPLPVDCEKLDDENIDDLNENMKEMEITADYWIFE